MLPLVYVLILNKTQESYTRVVQELLNLEQNINSPTIMIDFEQGLFGAFANVFPSVQIRGCFFYFGQCIWRKIQSFSDI